MNTIQKQTSLHASSQKVFDLGTHTLEVLENQGVLLMDTTTGKEVVQLDEEATYLLVVALTSLYQHVTEE